MDYTIKAGDNLSKIAQVNNTTVGALSSANNISNPNLIQVGKVLRIPTATPNASISNLANPAQMQGSIQAPPVPPASDQSAITNAQLYLNSQANVDNALAPYETANKSIIDQYKEQSGMLVNKTADLNDYNNTLDTQGIGTVNFNKKQAVDLANQILANKTQGQVQQLEKGRLGGLTVGGAQNIDEEINRQTAVKNLTLGAQLTAAQGNLALAQDLVTQSIDAKYAPIEAKLANLKNYYDMNQTELTRVDKKAFQSQQLALAAQQKDLETKKKNDTDIQTILINASSQNAPANLVAKAAKAKTPGEAAMILGQYSGDFYKTELLKNQIETEKAQRSKIYNDMKNANLKTDGLNQNGKPLKVSNAEITDLNDAIRAKNSVVSLINQFKQNITDNGTQVLYGTAAGDREALKTNLLLEMKSLAKTGALDQGTIDVLSGTIPENKFFATASAQQAALDNLLKTVTNKADEHIKSYRGTTAEFDPRTIRGFAIDQNNVPTPNKFQQAINPNASTPILGTPAIKNISSDGSIDFDIPTANNKIIK